MREVKVSKATEEILNQIAILKGCSMEEAAQMVLESYAGGVKKQIETSRRTEDHFHEMIKEKGLL